MRSTYFTLLLMFKEGIMKKTSLAVAALLTTLTAATIVPVAYADINGAQVATCSGSCTGCKGCNGCKGCKGCKGSCAGCKGSCAGSTDGACSGS